MSSVSVVRVSDRREVCAESVVMRDCVCAVICEREVELGPGKGFFEGGGLGRCVFR